MNEQKKSRTDQWLWNIRNHPVVAGFIVVCVIALAVIKWGNEITDELGTLLQHLGIIEKPETRLVIERAYFLGKAVAWRSYYDTRIGAVKETPPDDIKASYENKNSELKSILNQLHISIQSNEQDFVSRVLANYQDSSAALYYRDEIRSQYGDRALEAYEFGLRIESFFWMAVEERFKHSILDPGFWAEGALAELNKYAGRFDLEPTSIKLSEEKMVGDSWANLSIKRIVYDYDKKFKEKF